MIESFAGNELSLSPVGLVVEVVLLAILYFYKLGMPNFLCHGIPEKCQFVPQKLWQRLAQFNLID